MANEIVQPAKRKIDALMKRYEDRIKVLVPNGYDRIRYTNTAFFAIRAVPDLMEVAEKDPASLIGAVMQCAANGLTPNTNAREAFIVPFNNKKKDLATGRDEWQKSAQVIIGYPGLRKLAINSGIYKHVYARLVFEGDHFRYTIEPEGVIQHEPGSGYGDEESIGPNGQGLMGAYAVAVFLDGTKYYDWRPIASLNLVRERSKKNGKEGPAWRAWPGQQYKKTALRRMCVGDLLISPEARGLMQLDSAAEAGKDQKLGDLLEGESTLMGLDDLDMAPSDMMSEDDVTPDQPTRNKSAPARKMAPQPDGTSKAEAKT